MTEHKTPAQDGEIPAESGVYLDRLGNVWRKYTDGVFRMLAFTHPVPVSRFYAPFKRLDVVEDRPAAGVATQEPSEPTYSPATRQWSSQCPCILAEQVDPECEWHGRPEFRRGGLLHHDTPAPSPDREKLIGSLKELAHPYVNLHISDDTKRTIEQAASALAASVAVDEAKLAEVIGDSFQQRRPYEGLAAGAARRAIERQSEWLGGGER